MGIPVCVPPIPENALAYVTHAIEKNWISSTCFDPEVDYITKLERGFAAYVGVAHGVAVTNGTVALHLAVAALGIGPGDEVILPASTIISSALAVVYCGATPRFVDVDPHTWCMDVTQVEAAITPRTKAVMPVHLYGYPVEMETLLALAKRNGLAIIEDAAEAIGTVYHGKPAGGIGDVGIFSLYANKSVTSGEGGILVTDDDALAVRLRSLKNLAFGEPRFVHEAIGYNYRMNNLTAAYAYASFEEVEENVRRRQHHAARYDALLARLPGVVRPPQSTTTHKNSYWMYAILIDEAKFGMNKDALRIALKQDFGIDSRDFFFPLHQQPIFLNKGLIEAGQSLPVSERLWHEGMYLPSSIGLTEAEIEEVSRALHQLHR